MQTESYDSLIGATAFDSFGEKIGEIKDVFYDDVSGRPEWIAVKTGTFGGRRLVPISGATMVGGEDETRVELAYNESTVKDAPDIDEDEHLEPEEEQALYRHYGFDWSSSAKDDFGYGPNWKQPRFDRDYDRSRLGAIGQVPVTGQPRTVRLRRVERRIG